MKYFLIALLIMSGMEAFSQQKYDSQWGKADSLSRVGQPQSALEIVNSIREETRGTAHTAQYLKATLYRMKLKADFEENALKTLITETENELKSAGFPEKNILHSVLSELYWRYYQANRYKFLDRTETAGYVSEDIDTWDLKKITERCIQHYRLSLDGMTELGKIQAGVFDAIIISDSGTRTFRPTLFDFLAHRAIDFYMNSESGLTRPATEFRMTDPAYFSGSATFASFPVITSDSSSFNFRAISLLQEVIKFHLADKDPSALVDAELKRLDFVHRVSGMEDSDSLYLSALARLESRLRDHPASADVAFAMAQFLLGTAGKYQPLLSDAHKWDLQKACDLAEATISRFPEAFGSQNCRCILEQAHQQSLDITTEYAGVPGQPLLALVTAKNIKSLHFRIFRVDPAADREWTERGEKERIRKYLDLKSLKSWSITFPSDGDFQVHKAEAALPVLDRGFYILLASPDQNFGKESLVTINKFWVTGLSYISSRGDDGAYEIHVLDRDEGNPLPGIRVESFYREYDYNQRKYTDKPGGSYLTNADGYVKIPGGGRRNGQFYLVFSSGRDRYITESYFYSYNYGETEPRTVVTTHFFTDRSIYRPLQSVYFKGIVIERKGEEVSLKTNYKTEVVFTDVNGQKVSSLSLVTNDYGSFSGSFTTPAGALTGEMTIRCETGAASFSVEEYKRPKFEVTFDPVSGSCKLGEQVTVTGKAMNYAGNAVTEGKVAYRVVRRARYPYLWWGWREWLPSSPEMEITSGTSITDGQGKFNINFTAIPDQTVEERFSPVFTYTVYADVTDINGETHSGDESVSAGYKALLLSTNLPEEVNMDKPLIFTLSATNLDGQKVGVQGRLSVWKLKEPSRMLRERKWGRPDLFTMSREEFEKNFPYDIYENEGDFTTWAKEKQLFSRDFNSRNDSLVSASPFSDAGTYLVVITAKDTFGETVEVKSWFRAYSPGKELLPGHVSAWLAMPETKAEPGTEVGVYLGSAWKKVSALVETQNKSGYMSRKVMPADGFRNLEFMATEACRGNFSVNVVIVKHNRVYSFEKLITVPYTNKKLDISISSFRDKLEPGQQEEWQVTIRDMAGQKTAAELLAGMYDASLDAFRPHSWQFGIYSSFYGYRHWDVNAAFVTRGSITAYFPVTQSTVKTRLYDRLNWFGFDYYGGEILYSLKKSRAGDRTLDAALPMAVMEDKAAKGSDEQKLNEAAGETVTAENVPRETLSPSPVPAKALKIRSDLSETAFFFPQLATNEQGEVVLKFKMPESLTRWNLMGLAYTRDLKTGQIEKSLVTRKDLMVFPNVPRFFREGDHMQLSAKISNLSDVRLSGTAELHFFDAFTMQPVDGIMNLAAGQVDFSIGTGESSQVSWNISVPEGLQAVVYRVTATSGTFSDGEEAAVPVLTNRMLVTETLPLPVNGNQSGNFKLDKLIKSGAPGSTLRNYRLTLEFSSNPAWYAVQALPYLMEYPYECAEQVFSRYYANSMATFIANSDPKIKRVFESWKNISPDALKSNLEKNQELKSVLLEESPWVREASDERERKQRIGLLFDLNRMKAELGQAIKKLEAMQVSNGGFPWFAGMPDSRYITQHIVTGLGHLDHLGVTSFRDDSEAWEMLRSAVSYLDARMQDEYNDTRKYDKDFLRNDHLGYETVQYLYARSYFTDDFPVEPGNREAFDYFKAQASANWATRNNYMKGMIALALNRLGDKKLPGLVMRSLSETALHNEETGMYWRNENRGWYWYQAPIETQALMIEAFDEVLNDAKSVEELKVWLLKQKQTQDWKTTKATTEAVYALLLRGTGLLASDQLAEVKVGKVAVDPRKQEGYAAPEAGTGYYKTSWNAAEITPDMGRVAVNNPNPSVAWGALYWQYFEQPDRITPAETPLKLDKKLFREISSPTGPVLEPVTGATPLKVGDKVVVRIELRSDRDMEYVHLKDMRASAFEPVNVLSGCRWQGGLGYYESTRDAASNFFISYLPKGTYVFEYRLVASQKGEFSNGITSVQCMYAPEFAAHSEGIRVKVE